jgi:hypothetical protein
MATDRPTAFVPVASDLDTATSATAATEQFISVACVIGQQVYKPSVTHSMLDEWEIGLEAVH